MALNKPRSVLLIGWDSNICLGVLYCLHKYNFTCYLLTHNSKNAAKFSRFVKKAYFYEESEDQSAHIIRIVKKHQIDLIMPYDEIDIRKVTENKDLLSKHAACVWGTEPELFTIGIHKRKLAEFLDDHKLPCPPFTTFDNKLKLESIIADFGFPLLVKPVRSSAGRMIQKLSSKEAVQDFFASGLEDKSNFILQPFIVGSDITCNVICRHGEILCYTIQESPVKSGSDFNSNDTLCYHEDEQVISVVGQMMKKLNWHGVACVDIRRDARTNAIYVLEINGRFWASVAPSYVKAGVNFPVILAMLSLEEQVELPRQKDAKQISLQQYIEMKKSRQKASFRDTKFMAYFADPIARMMQLAWR